MKQKALILSAVFTIIAAGLGVGVYLYASSQKTTFSPPSPSPEQKPVFRLITSPPDEPCVAYVYRSDDVDPITGTYHYYVSTIESTGYIESREGYMLDCVTCISRCSAYYELCDEYGIEYEYEYE